MDLQKNLYNEKIIGFAANILHIGHLPKPDISAKAASRLCGSHIEVELCLDKRRERVSEFAHQIEACILGQASAAIVAESVIGSTKNELRELRRTMREMLQNNASPPTGKWQALEVLQTAIDYKARHGSVMLIFEALELCFKKLEALETLEAD